MNSTNKDSLRVLHVLYKLERGGLECRIMDVYRHLDKEKFQFDFYIESGTEGDFDVEVESMGGRIYYGKERHLVNIPSFKVFDIFLMNNPYKYVCAYNQWSGWYLERALVHGVPNRIAVSVTALDNTGLKNKIKNSVRYKANEFANYRVAVSEVSGRWLFGDDAFDNQCIRVIPNAINAEKFHFSNDIRAKIRGELRVKDEKVLMHVGNIRSVKNQQFLVKILAEMVTAGENVVLVLVGRDTREDGGINRIFKLAENLSVLSRVKYLGERDDVNHLLCAGDIFVFPSLYEGFPGAVLEAQASGVRCFISDTVTREVILSDDVTVLSLEKGAKSWADAIIARGNKPLNERGSGVELIKKSGYDAINLTKRVEHFFEC